MHASLPSRRQMICTLLGFALTSTACGGCGEDDEPAPDMTGQGSDQGGTSDMDTAPDQATPEDMGDEPDDSIPEDMGEGKEDMPIDRPDMPVVDTGYGTLGWMVGRSQVGERPLIAELYGDEGPVLFLLSAIHGSERIAITYGERVRTLLLGGMAERLGVRIFYVQAANPDGIEAGSRHNARNVDLNRNFPAENFDPTGTGGSEPLSESESIMLALALDWTEPAAVVSVHCCGALIDHDGPGEALGYQMQQATRQHVDFAFERLGSRPGSMGSYVGLTLLTPIVTVEMDRHARYDAIDQFAGIEAATEAAALWVAGQQGEGIDVLERVDPLDVDNHYRQRAAGTSSSGLTLRMDTLGATDGALHNLVLSGVDGGSRTGENIAEHLRREMLAELDPSSSQPLKILTLANPESLQSLSRENIDGVDVLADAIRSAPASSEGQALRALLTDPDLQTVYLVEDASEDHHVVLGPASTAILRRTRNTGAGIPEKQEVPAAYATVAEWLVARGKNVVFLGAHTERYEDQHDSSAPSPSPYWRLIRGTL